MSHLAKKTGFPPGTGDPVLAPESAAIRPLLLQWMTDDLVAHTRRVWSQAYRRSISEAEAMEILMNVRRLAEVVWRSVEKGQTS